MQIFGQPAIFAGISRENARLSGLEREALIRKIAYNGIRQKAAICGASLRIEEILYGKTAGHRVCERPSAAIG